MYDLLIVDDDPDVRGMLGFAFGDRGFQVRDAKHGEQALEELRRQAPDCMVLDVTLPDIDGFSVLVTMRAEDLAAGTKVVIVTGKDDERALVRGRELRADDYVCKPFDPDRLVDRVRALLA